MIDRRELPRVRDLMDDRGLTVADLARLAGCSRRQAEYYSSGKKRMSELELLGLMSVPKRRGGK